MAIVVLEYAGARDTFSVKAATAISAIKRIACEHVGLPLSHVMNVAIYPGGDGEPPASLADAHASTDIALKGHIKVVAAQWYFLICPAPAPQAIVPAPPAPAAAAAACALWTEADLMQLAVQGVLEIRDGVYSSFYADREFYWSAVSAVRRTFMHVAKMTPQELQAMEAPAILPWFLANCTDRDNGCVNGYIEHYARTPKMAPKRLCARPSQWTPSQST